MTYIIVVKSTLKRRDVESTRRSYQPSTRLKVLVYMFINETGVLQDSKQSLFHKLSTLENTDTIIRINCLYLCIDQKT